MLEMKTLTVNGRTYSLMDETARERIGNLETAGRIINAVSGSEISLQDSANVPLQGLILHGKTTQSGTALNAAGAGGAITATIARSRDVSSVFGLTAAAGRVENDTASKLANPTCIGGVKFNGSDDNSYIMAFRAAANTDGLTVTTTTFTLHSITLTNTETQETIAFDFSGLANADGTAKELPIGTQAADGSWVNVDRYGANVKAETDYIRWKNGKVDSWCAFRLNGIPAGRYRIDFDLPLRTNGAAADVYIMSAGEQTIAIPTPYGLHGITVTTGGYYTDENGYQWHCDEVDLDRGVYVQRCGYIASYNGEDITGAYISSSGSLSTGAKVVYALPKPIETSLDEETLAAYAALHTYKGANVIYNDAGAGQSVEYVADTKTYIDNQLKAITNAIVSMGANI